LPESLLGVVDNLEVLVLGVDPDLGVTTLGGVGTLVGDEIEDFPEETEDTDDRGVLCLLILNVF